MLGGEVTNVEDDDMYGDWLMDNDLFLMSFSSTPSNVAEDSIKPRLFKMRPCVTSNKRNIDASILMNRYAFTSGPTAAGDHRPALLSSAATFLSVDSDALACRVPRLPARRAICSVCRRKGSQTYLSGCILYGVVGFDLCPAKEDETHHVPSRSSYSVQKSFSLSKGKVCFT